MNTNQVDCFLCAAKYSSFSAAAAELYLTPQAVSKQVISLEKELDTRLFDRNGPRLRLTEIGTMYRRLFEGQVKQYDFLLDDIRLHRKSLALSLRIGVSEWIELFGPFGDGFRAFFGEKFGKRVVVEKKVLDQARLGVGFGEFFRNVFGRAIFDLN